MLSLSQVDVHLLELGLESRVLLVNEVAQLRPEGHFDGLGVDVLPEGLLSLVAQLGELLRKVDFELVDEVSGAVERIEADLGEGLVADVVNLELNGRKVRLVHHHVDLRFDLHQLVLVLFQALLHVGLLLRAFLHLQVHRLGVPLDLLDALDDLVFEDFLTVVQVGQLFGHGAVLPSLHACPSAAWLLHHFGVAGLAQHQQLGLKVLVLFLLQVGEVVVAALAALHARALLPVKVQI